MKTFAFISEQHNTFGMPSGWGNGYVVVTSGHPAYGLDYDSDLLDSIIVHGGITWAKGENPRIGGSFEWITEQPDTDDIWVIGFDTMHFNSDSSMTKEWVIQETFRLKEQIYNIK